MSLYARLVVGLLIALAIAAGWWKVDRVLAAREEAGYQRRAAEDAATAQAQAERNRDLQRAAELRYTVQAQARDRFIVTTVTEVRNATASLAACPVGADGVRLFNAAAACTRQDRPASCGAGVALPDAP